MTKLIEVIPYLNMDVTSCDPMMFHFLFVTSFVAFKKVDSKFGFHQFVVDEFGTVHICVIQMLMHQEACAIIFPFFNNFLDTIGNFFS